MRLLLSVFMLSLFCINAHAQEVTVLAASGTSKSDLSDNVTCLLDDNCTGIWQPDSQDDGVDEGYIFNLKNPCYCIQLKCLLKKSLMIKRLI